MKGKEEEAARLKLNGICAVCRRPSSGFESNGDGTFRHLNVGDHCPWANCNGVIETIAPASGRAHYGNDTRRLEMLMQHPDKLWIDASGPKRMFSGAEGVWHLDPRDAVDDIIKSLAQEIEVADVAKRRVEAEAARMKLNGICGLCRRISSGFASSSNGIFHRLNVGDPCPWTDCNGVVEAVGSQSSKEVSNHAK
jgi:hypothetical protein